MSRVKHSFVLFAVLSLVLCESCSKDDTAEVRSVVIEMPSLDYDVETRASVNQVGTAFQFVWMDTDEVGIFPNQGGYQLGFSLAGQGGQRTATFNGGGWALRTDAAYSTYYPFRFENKDPERIPIGYTNQKQVGNDNTGHLGAYYYCATEPSSAVDGKVTFALNNIGSIVSFVITVPDAANYTEISLVTDDNLFTTAGTYDLKNFDLSITPTKMDKKVSLALENVTTTSSNQVINAYMMVAPFDLTGHSYKLYVKTDGGIYYSADLATKNHVWGRNIVRKITATVEMSDGYNMGIGEWGNGGNIGGDAN